MDYYSYEYIFLSRIAFDLIALIWPLILLPSPRPPGIALPHLHWDLGQGMFGTGLDTLCGLRACQVVTVYVLSINIRDYGL